MQPNLFKNHALSRIIKSRFRAAFNHWFTSVINQENKFKFRMSASILSWILGLKNRDSSQSKIEFDRYESWLLAQIRTNQNSAPTLDFQSQPTSTIVDARSIAKNRFVFLDLHPRQSITSNVIYEMYLSSLAHSSFTSQYHNLAELSNEEYLALIRDLGKQESFINILIFEVHTSSELNGGSLSKELIMDLRRTATILLMPVCFDIYRKFDLRFIEYWESLCLAFLHVDAESASKLPITKPLIFWPFVLPKVKKRAQISDPEPHNQQSPSFLFSGSFKSPGRKSTLLFLKARSFKYGFRIRIRSNAKVKDFSDERDMYLNELQSAAAVINFNTRPEVSHSLLTFRAIETITMNGCLLDQSSGNLNTSLTKIAVPYKHFIPFKSDWELLQLCRVLNANPSIARTIQFNCSRLTADELSQDSLWAYLECKIIELSHASS